MTVRHWGMILLAAALFGSSFVFIKIAVADIPPLTIAAGRATIAAIVIIAFAHARGTHLPPIGPEWRPLVIVGVLTAIIPYVGISFGQALIDSALGGILFAAIPLFTVFLAHVFLPNERLTAVRLAGALIGVAGVVVVLGPAALAGLTNQITGAGLTLVAAASYAAGAIYTRTQSQIAPLIMASGQIFSAALALTALSIGIDKHWTLAPPTSAVAALIAVGLISTAAPVLLFFRMVYEIGPARTSTLTFFMPVFSVLFGFAFLGETLSSTAFFGLALIIVGAAMINRRPTDG
ncbi:DMT family transporter [Aliiroseovarius sp. 2305UL8-7]|uniref:DMT family transporter n=1 Tax=Aliiroseovarius conchicola TaxID=3121637 RepID=UPI003528C5BE